MAFVFPNGQNSDDVLSFVIYKLYGIPEFVLL